MPYTIKSNALHFKDAEGEEIGADAFYGQNTTNELDQLKTEVNALKSDLSDIKNAEMAEATGKVWGTTADGAGWIDAPTGGSEGDKGENCHVYTTDQADDLYIAQFVNTLKTYYDNRKKSDGSNTFVYGHDTAVDGTAGNQIDCSAYVALGLMGVPFSKSPYADISTVENTGAEDNGNDGGGSSETDGDGGEITIEIGDYDWAIDLKQYKRKLVNNISPVRTASQMAELLNDSGWSVEFADDFSNLKRGDIIFYAKKNGEAWVQPNRYHHISHVAVVSSTFINNGSYGIDAKYPYKHTLFEVSTYGNVVLNTTLEKRYPESVVMVCRPQFGAKSERYGIGSAYAASGKNYDINTLFVEGTYYLMSNHKVNLPSGVSSGLGYTVDVRKSFTNWGKPYSIIQTLYNTRGGGIYVRKQYLYPSYVPDADKWTEWESVGALQMDEILPVVNDIIDSKLGNLDAAVTRLEEVSGLA